MVDLIAWLTWRVAWYLVVGLVVLLCGLLWFTLVVCVGFAGCSFVYWLVCDWWLMLHVDSVVLVGFVLLP